MSGLFYFDFATRNIFAKHYSFKQYKMVKQMYPCLWFDGQAKAAATYYCSIFKNSKITAENPIVVNFELNGNKFMGLNGGPKYKFTPATSFVIECETQDDIDYYWEKLGEGGRYDQCGWLDDKFGVSWQVVPAVLHQLMADPVKAPRVIEAFMKMSKFEIKTLLDA
jgi:predicted 3-demethylubiquinone-9 3-methyltransferase (glyoxalase superfamily)